MQTLLIFLKAPVAGRVKTRLAEDLGAQRAAEAYVEMAASIAAELRRLEASGGVAVRYVYAAAPEFPDLAWLGEAEHAFWPQGEGDLGARLKRAFARAFADGAERVCVIGTDSPGLRAEDYRAAFAALDDNDAVVGPTEDGGYYLIGMARLTPALFDGITWSSPRVCEETRAAAAATGLRLAELRAYFDIDTLAEYRRWRKQAAAMPPSGE